MDDGKRAVTAVEKQRERCPGQSDPGGVFCFGPLSLKRKMCYDMADKTRKQPDQGV